MILFLIALLAGALTVLAPCTISLLPVIVGGTLGGQVSLRRALVVTVSLGAAVILFTLALKASTAFITVPQSFWQELSGVIIIVLGIAMIFPMLWDMIPGLALLNRDSTKLMSSGYLKQNLIGDILVGVALGPVFSSCSPTYFLILATVLPRSFSAGLLYLFAYAFGLCVTLFLVAIAGQKILAALGVASDPKGWIKRGVGVIFLALGIAIFFGWDKTAEAAVASRIFDVTQIEQHLLQAQGTGATGLPAPTGTTTEPGDGSIAEATSTPAALLPQPPTGVRAARLAMKAAMYPKAPEITDPSGSINTGGQPITIGQFKGKKVVLIDFWTYSCINCQRTLPYLKAWYDKYHDEGLEIIGIHTPEFAFEHVLGNVQAAVTGFGLLYPVVLDNDYGTWNAFGNSYWPRKYLIDIDGYVVYDHAGEGDYDVTESAIQKALAERVSVLGMDEKIASGTVAPIDAIQVQAGGVQSPETYFGAARNEYLGNGMAGQAGAQTLTLPKSYSLNTLYLDGAWTFEQEFAHTGAKNAGIVYRFSARDVYFVASSAQGAKLLITVDGKPAMQGTDVQADGTATIKENRLYNIVHAPDYGAHILEIRVESGELDAYTFTFG